MKKRLMVLAPLTLLCLTSCGEVHHDISEYFLEMDWKEGFTILQFTDVHIANKDDQQRQFDFLDLSINEANADLIVFTGDTFTFADKITANRFFKWMDSHEIPWTITFGNHDEQTYFPIDWLTSRLNQLTNDEDSYCIFKDIQDDDVFGNANFAINLMDGDKVKKQIILMDSNRYCFGDYYGYDQFHEDQVQWYSDLVDYTTNELNDGTPVDSYAFFHIPLPEMEVVRNLMVNDPENPDIEIVRNEKVGAAEEGVSCPQIGVDGDQMFETMVDKGSTVAMFNGHDHTNNYAALYKDILFCYGINSTDRIYFDEALLGAQRIILNDDFGSFCFCTMYHSYEEVDE